MPQIDSKRYAYKRNLYRYLKPAGPALVGSVADFFCEKPSHKNQRHTHPLAALRWVPNDCFAQREA